MNAKLLFARTKRSPAAVALAVAAVALVAVTAQAASTDISSQPLANAAAVAAKPNIMFILDDSGSMGRNYMPDDMDDSGKYGFKTAQCNGVAYDPTYTYTPPIKADGTNYPNASFTAAAGDGYTYIGSNARNSTTSLTIGTGSVVLITATGTNTSYAVGDAVAITSATDGSVWMAGDVTGWTGTATSPNRQLTVNVTATSGSGTLSSWKVSTVTNLSGSSYYTYSGTEKAMDWTYTPAGVITTTNFYKQCMSNVGVAPGSGVFTSVSVTTADTAAIQQNYANWYSYYRTRQLMMRTATGRAFSGLNSSYRVGFSVISDTGVTDGTNGFRDIADFDTSHKANFYSSLYTASTGSATPLRGALSKAGRYFANMVSGQASDPMQYSCQRNYAILSTDGYWNTNDETTSYRALKLNGTSLVGQQDGTEVRPMFDGADQVSTAVTPTTTIQRKQTSGTRNDTATWSRWNYPVPATTGGGSCSGTQYRIRVQQQNHTQTIPNTTTSVDDVTTVVTNTIVTTNGTITSNTNSTSTSSTNVSFSSTPGSATFGGWSNSGGRTDYCRTLVQLTAAGMVPGGNYYSSTGCGPGCTYTSIAAAANGVQTSGVSTGAVVPGTVNVLSTAGPTVGTTVTTNTTSGGSSSSLADIAEYYYQTDLRTSALGNCTGALGTDICNNTLKPLDRDIAPHQHMTSYTIGLGVNGTLTYDAGYLTQLSGSYVQLKNGTINWPVPTVATTGGDATNVDDLWHAAVNGRGRYFATTNATTLANALSGALADANKVVGSAAGASTNSLKPVAGEDNRAYIATYTTVEWSGDLSAYPLDATDGSIKATPADRVWSAQALLDAKAAGSRVIKYKAPASTALNDFTLANLTTDGYSGYFTNLCSKPTVPTQCASLTAGQVTLANSGTNLVNFLRGDETYEASTNVVNPLYRERAHKLGDIVNGSPVYVKKPPFAYADTGYSSFASAQASRAAVLYAPSNDGMLHAFNASTGDEIWAYIPTFVMPSLYRLADSGYSTSHRYFVDGTPVVGDINVGGTWKTILVGGLNAGGKGYYALDITNPSSPVALWEFTDANMGFTYGNPIITKRADGTWVVVVTSGYNNTSGDGMGHLYVLNANTGAVLHDLSTGTGSAATPSGLGKINAWVDLETDNTAKRFYGGDLMGNLWRFDTDDLIAPTGSEATKLGSLMVGTTPQPITVAPQPAQVRYAGQDYAVVFVATGRYLGNTDVSDTTQQSVYGIKDALTATGWGDVRTNSGLVSQTVTAGTTTKTVTNNAVDWSTKIGWKVDLPESKERVVTEMVMQFTNLVAASAIPGGTECDPAGGSSWLYQFDIATGGAANTSNTLATYLGNFLTVGLTWFQTAGGDNKAVRVGSDASVGTENLTTGRSSGGTPHRTSWRELVNQ